MRSPKKTALPSLLACAFLAAAFLPVGADTVIAPGGETVRSQELVFCETDASGQIIGVRVIDTMGLNKGAGALEIRERYLFAGKEPSRVAGVSGFKKPALEGDQLVWKGLDSGERGINAVADFQFSKAMVEEARQRIPLDVEYRYYLDSKRVSGPEEIRGKSGHFRLEATFTNTSRERRNVKYTDPETGETVTSAMDVYLPLVIQPYDWKFDNQHFFNLRADPTAVVVPLPDVYQPGWSIPLFPPATEASQTIWVEADVKDFRMPVLTLVIAFVFPETNQADPLETFGPGLEQLIDGVKQLDEGLKEAVAGLGSAATPDTLIYGISKVYDGLLKLASQTEGLGYAKSNIDSAMLPGVNQLYGGTDLVLGGLSGAKQGIAQLKSGINQVIAGLRSGDPENPGIKEGMQQIVAALNAPFVSPEDTGLIAALQFIRSQIGPASDPDTLLGQVNALIANLTQPIPPGPEVGPLGSLWYYVHNAPLFGGSISPVSVAHLEALLTGIADQLTDKLPELELLYESLGDGTDPDTIIGGLFYMSAVLTSMINGIGDAATPDTIIFGLSQILMGMAQLEAGIGSVSEPNSLIGGVTQIKYGLSGAPVGQLGIKEGLQQLSSGLGEAIAGLGSAGTPDTLLYGASQIEQGMGTLKSGLEKATSEGTEVMIAGLDGSITTIRMTQAELEAIRQRAAEFDAFLGKPEKGESEVRFIYQTAAVYDYMEGGSWVTALILSVVIALGLTALGIFAFRRLT